MKTILQGSQMLFVAFGSLVLVPLLTGLDPNVALFGAGVGTLLFQLITRRSVPIFLASSFAFIAPIMFGVQTWGVGATMGGLMAAGVVYVIMGAVIKAKGVEDHSQAITACCSRPGYYGDWSWPSASCCKHGIG